jgi:uncharacterized membrane protein
MRPSRVLLAATVAAQLAYPRLAPRRQPAATRAIVALLGATAVADAREANGRRGVIQVAAAAGTGLAAELAGVATGRPFGAYSYTDALGPRVRGVPVLAPAAWAMMARPAWAVAPPGPLRVPAAAAALTAWDLCLDPRMVRDGYWRWHGGGRYEDVPLSNFAGWLGTGCVLFSLWALLEPRDAGDERLALATYSWTWVGELVANLVFWRRPRVVLAGGGAMGAFALPALRRRLR